ncbi:hypothetical protein ACIRQF_30870 [Streptomyces sp. NPDC101191]|uniref:hypothetical protein n=1 Tax=Streptomyces sp. NPDC101191 TaxID=3366126 RepID=UPI00381072F9
MAEEQHDEHRRLAQLRQLEEERRTRTVAADLRRRQQERQAQDEAALADAPAAEAQHYAQLPRHSHTGIR